MANPDEEKEKDENGLAKLKASREYLESFDDVRMPSTMPDVEESDTALEDAFGPAPAVPPSEDEQEALEAARRMRDAQVERGSSPDLSPEREWDLMQEARGIPEDQRTQRVPMGEEQFGRLTEGRVPQAAKELLRDRYPVVQYYQMLRQNGRSHTQAERELVRHLMTLSGLDPDTAYQRMRNIRDPESGEDVLMSDAQILREFLDMKDASKYEAFMETAARDAFEVQGAITGAWAGAKVGGAAGSRAPVPGPVKFWTTIGGTVTGAVIGGTAGLVGGDILGEYIGDWTTGDGELPLDTLPAQTAAETSAYVIGMTYPMHGLSQKIPENVNIGSKWLRDRANGWLGRKAAKGVEILEDSAASIGKFSRENPKTALGTEYSAAATIGTGSYVAEAVDPGDEGTRLGLEITGSILDPRRIVTSVTSPIKSAARSIMRATSQGARQDQAGRYIVDSLQAIDENPEEIMEALLNETLLDKDGNPITMTAAQKLGSPALLAIEKQLGRADTTFKQQVDDAGRQAIQKINGLIGVYRMEGSPEALRRAAQLEIAALTGQLRSEIVKASGAAELAAQQMTVEASDAVPNMSILMADEIDKGIAQFRQIEDQVWREAEEGLDTMVDATVLLEDWFEHVSRRAAFGQPYAEEMGRWVRQFGIDDSAEAAVEDATAKVAQLQSRAGAADEKMAGLTTKNGSAATIFDNEMEGAFQAGSDWTQMTSTQLKETIDILGDVSTRYTRTGTEAVPGISSVDRRAVAQMARTMIDRVNAERQLRAARSEAGSGRPRVAHTEGANQVSLRELQNIRSQALNLARMARKNDDSQGASAYSYFASLVEDLFNGTEKQMRRDNNNLLFDPRRDGNLTPTQAVVVEQAMQGKSLQEIADELSTASQDMTAGNVSVQLAKARKRLEAEGFDSEQIIPRAKGRGHADSKLARVAKLLDEGVGTAAIAERLGISENMVYQYRHRINKRRLSGQADYDPGRLKTQSPEAQEKLLRALAVTRTGNDVLRNAFVNTTQRVTALGEAVLPPELMARKLLTGSDPTKIAYQYEAALNAVTMGGPDNPLWRYLTPAQRQALVDSGHNFNDAMANVLRAMANDQIMMTRQLGTRGSTATTTTGERAAAERVFPPGEEIQVVSPTKAAAFRRRLKPVLDKPAFRALDRDLSDAVTATQAYYSAMDELSLAFRQNRDIKRLDEILYVGDTRTAVAGALEGKNPTADMNAYFRAVNKLPDAEKAPAREALFASVVDWAVDRSLKAPVPGQETVMSARRLREVLYEPLSTQQDSPMTMMVNSGMIDQKRADDLKALIGHMENVEVAMASPAQLAGLVAEDDPLYDVAVSLLGAKAGRDLGQKIGAGGTVQIPGIGVQQAKNMLQKSPMTSTRTLLLEATKPSNDGYAGLMELIERGLKEQEKRDVRKTQALYDWVGRTVSSPALWAAAMQPGVDILETDQDGAPFKYTATRQGFETSSDPEGALLSPAPSPAETPRPAPPTRSIPPRGTSVPPAPTPQLRPRLENAPTPPPAAPPAGGQGISGLRYAQAFGPFDPMTDLAMQRQGIAGLR